MPSVATRRAIGEQESREQEYDQLSAAQGHLLPPDLKLLVIEDNMILALDVEDMLLRNGAAGVAVARTCAEALQLLDHDSFGAALLDLRLPDDGSLQVATRLKSLNTPFLFATGYGETAIAPEPFQAVPVVGKPYNEFFLLTRLAALLSDRPDAGRPDAGRPESV